MQSQRTFPFHLLLVVSVLLLFETSLAVAAPTECDPSGSWSTCLGAKNGKVSIDTRERVSASDSSPIGKKAKSRRESNAAFCRDSADNSTSGSAMPSEVIALCRGIIALAGDLALGDVVKAFRELPLYRGSIQTAPRRATLVHFETWFWCGDEDGRGCEVVGEEERTVVLLGRPVRIRPRIVGYRWEFGDGGGVETDGRAAHTYAHAGHYTVTLTLTWTADYAVGQGALQPIEDTTTTTSPPRILPVREAQTVIVGG